MSFFGNGGSYKSSGHRVSRSDERRRDHQKHNGNGHKRGEFNGEKINGFANPLGGQIKSADDERSRILEEILDLKQFKRLRNPDPTSGGFYIEMDPESPEGIKQLAELEGKWEKLIAGHPEPGM
ncbi:MAG: hypothetical protein WBK55_01465 [Alphaproteobacteria bacterium]